MITKEITPNFSQVFNYLEKYLTLLSEQKESSSYLAANVLKTEKEHLEYLLKHLCITTNSGSSLTESKLKELYGLKDLMYFLKKNENKSINSIKIQETKTNKTIFISW